MEKISIITPSLNQAAFIESTILSVQEQAYPNFEHIIVDGGSIDGTIEILEKYKDSIRYISEPDTGQANAINKGLRMADGEILAFINSDDYYLPGTFQAVAESFHSSDALWLVGDYKIVDYRGNDIHSFVIQYKKFLRQNTPRHTLLIANYIPQPSTFWRNKEIQKIGIFDESLFFAFDYDFWLRLMEIGSPIVLSKKLSAFRIHPQSKGSRDYVKQLDEEIQILKSRDTDVFSTTLHRLNNFIIKWIYKIIK